MRSLSKSKLLAFRQCPKRLWLELHQPELCVDSLATQASYKVGNTVGDIARKIYDASGEGVLLDAQRDGYDVTLARSAQLIRSSQPIFEAGFSAEGAMAFADVMLPVDQSGKRGWRMVEVKSSTSVKDCYRDDVAIQSFVAKSAGIPLLAVALAHIDSSWCYPGGNDYQGLLVENDLTAEAFSRDEEVREWVSGAHSCASKAEMPDIHTGAQCSSPYSCGFIDFCNSQEPQPEYPVNWLPRMQTKVLKSYIVENDVSEMRDVPDIFLNAKQIRVKTHTLTGNIYFDTHGASSALKNFIFPAYFLDFETIALAVPVWEGTRPYQKIPFQFSLHRLEQSGALNDKAFLDLSGKDPSIDFAKALIEYCGESGPVFVYNAGFEKSIIRDLAKRFPQFHVPLMAIQDRIIDLLPIVENNYYHPCQKGSWSIKSVLPAIVPDLCYDALEGVQDGGMAMDAYLEAIHPDTIGTRKAEIEKQLFAYCGLDTYAMVRIWQIFAGK